MKFNFCENDHNELILAMGFISGCIMKTIIKNWPETEMKIFHLAQDEMSCKHPLKPPSGNR